MVAGAGRENGMETPMHENPEWEKARQALASISKAGAAGSSKASSNGPVASSQVRRPRGLGTLRGWGSLGAGQLGTLSGHRIRVPPDWGRQGRSGKAQGASVPVPEALSLRAEAGSVETAPVYSWAVTLLPG